MAQYMTSEFFWYLISGNVLLLISLLLYITITRIPKQYRTFPTFLPWLLFVPFGSLAVYWIIMPFGLPSSFREYYSKNPIVWKKPNESYGKRFGRNKGLTFVISITAFLIPVVWYVAAFVALISLVSFLIHMSRLANMIPLEASNEPAPSPTSSASSSEENVDKLMSRLASKDY